MRGSFRWLLGWILLGLSVGFAGLPGQEEDTREYVTVTHVEVPVRVVLKGRPVADLQRGDFRLSEDGEAQEIQGFYMMRKRIDTQRVKMASGRTEQARPRYFVLAFRITNLTDELRDSVRRFVDDILRPEDQVLLFINNRTLFFKRIDDVETVYTLIQESLRDEALKARFVFEKFYQQVQQSLNQTRMKALLSGSKSMTPADNMILFLNDYLRMWKEYKTRYLVPDIDTFYHFARLLETIQMEKWVIAFYQFEKFPQIKLSGDLRHGIQDLIGYLQMARSEDNAKARILSKLLTEVDVEMRVSDDFPAEEISKLFLRVGATFYSLFFTSYMDIGDPDFEFKEVSNDLENTLRAITRNTGGELIVSNRLETSLNEVSAREDIIYMLTYIPRRKEKRGRIRVEVGDRRYRVLYDDNIRADYIEDYLQKKDGAVKPVRLHDLDFRDKTVLFSVCDYRFNPAEAKSSGRVSLHLVVKSRSGEILYDQQKVVQPERPDTRVEVDFGWLKTGQYDLVIDARDLVTSRSAVEYMRIAVQ